MQVTFSSLGNQIVGQSVFALPKCNDEDFTRSQQRNVFLNAYIYMYICVYIYAFICLYNICYILHIYIERESCIYFFHPSLQGYNLK